MKRKYADAIGRAADDFGAKVGVLHTYSGRGMYGKQTSAVYGKTTAVMACMAYLAGDLASEEPTIDCCGELVEDLIQAINDLRTDDFGRDMIFY